MKDKVVLFAILKYIIDILGLAFILFVSAGTINYFDAWFLLIEIAILGIFYGIYMFINKKNIMEKRILEREKRKKELILIILSILLIIIELIISGISFRFNILLMPNWRYILSIVILVFGCTLFISVVNTNDYLFTTIKVEVKQHLIQNGPYKYIRHPMYTSVALIYLSMGLVLGSMLAIIISFLFLIILKLRIEDEELILINELNGYKEYMNKVKYKIIPYIW